MELKLSLLGPFAAWLDGRALAKFRTNKVQALLIYLAVESERAHRRDFLMDLLWPGLPQESAQVNLRQTIYRLNQAIPAMAARTGDETVPLLLSDRQTVQINPDAAFELDAATFTDLLKGEPTAEKLKQAVALYRGDFLADFYLPDSNTFEEWAGARRAGLRRQVLEALEKITTYALATDELAEAEQYARRQIEIDSLREAAYRQLMEALTRDGHRIAALTQYESLARNLQTELGVEPSAETQLLYEAIRAGQLDVKATGAEEPASAEHPSPPHPSDRRTYPEAAEGSPTPTPLLPRSPAPLHNLPPQPTPFIGREAELDALGHLIARPTGRLITIVGPGGMGKTRLALACAKRCLGALDLFANGVFFVNLAPLSEVDQIVPTLAQRLRFPLQVNDPRSPRQQVLDYLSRKRMLLVMDNFEHLLAGVDLLVEIAQAAPDVRILVTSRERLHLQLEQVYPLQGLAFPETETAAATKAMEDALIYPAVQLFRQCARRNQPDFDLHSAADVADVACICRLVAGMPLAIELAAAWVDTLSPADIADEIQQSLDFLEAELHDVPARHRSVRAAIDVSWERLTEREQTTLAQLSIFRGGFTRAAVQAVTGASLPLLSRLVNKSFLYYDMENDRYQIHELLRHFAAEKLAQAPEVETAVRNQHATYYCSYLHQLGEDLKGPRQVEAWQVIDVDFENGRLAWNWAISHQQLKHLQKIILLWDSFLMSWRVRYLEADRLYRDLVENLADNESLFVRQLLIQGLLCWARAKAHAGKHEKAFQLREQAEELSTQLPIGETENWPGKSFVLWRLSWHMNPPDPAKSREFLQQGIEVARRMGDQSNERVCLYASGHLASVQGNLKEGQKLLEESLALSHLLGDKMGRANALSSLSINALERNCYGRAAQLANEALSLNNKLEDIRGISINLESLGYAYLYTGQYTLAVRALRDKLQICQDYGIHSEIVWGNYQLSHIYLHSGQYEQAKALADISLKMAKGEGYELVRAHSLTMLGNCALVGNDPNIAKKYFAQCETIMRNYARPFTLKWYIGFFSVMQVHSGQLEAARQNIIDAFTVKADEYFNIIAAISLLYWAEKRWERAVELFALACQFPYVGKSQWFADTVGKMIEQAAAVLPTDVVAAARRRGRELDGRKIIPELLAELKMES